MLTLTVSPTLVSFQNNQISGGQQVRDGQVTVTLPRAGASVRRVAELALAKLGLSGQTLTDFNSWAKTDFSQDATNQLTRQGVANDIRQATGANITFKIIIKASLIKWLQEFGLTFAQAPNGEFSGSATLKEGSAIGGAFAGAAIGGWAGAVYGPAAVICVPLGIFVGGIIGAYAGESLYEAGRDAVINEDK